MAKVISICNRKGGTGKTTTAVNLSTYLAYLGNTVLLIDIDPQANATSGLGIDHQKLEHGVYEAIISEKQFRHIILGESTDKFRLAPATMGLAGASIELVDMDRREYKLHDIIQDIREEYDYIIIDSPPSLGLLTLNGLVAADEVMIPVQAEYYALEGLGQLMHTINLVQNNLLQCMTNEILCLMPY
jgi:chromosome partitioning protein